MIKNMKINNEKMVTENFHGISYIHHAYEFMPDDKGRILNEEQIQVEINNMKNMGITMIRSFYGGSLTWDDEKKEHNFESEYMMAFYKACKMFADAGIEVGITPGWHISGFIKDWMPEGKKFSVNLDYHGGFVEGDLEATAKNFEKFIEDSVYAFERHGVTNIKHIFCFTECNNCFNYNNRAEKDAKKVSSFERREIERLYPLYDRMIRAVDQGLKNSGKRDQFKIVAPCDNWSGDASEPISWMVKYTVENLSEQVDIIGAHNGYDRSFDFKDKRAFYDLLDAKLTYPRDKAKEYGKEYYVDEFNVVLHSVYTCVRSLEANDNPYRGLAFGAMMNKILNMGGIHTLYIWALYSQQWPNWTYGGINAEFLDGIQILGYLHNLRHTRVPTYPWYAAAMMTRQLKEGNAYEGDDNENTYISYLERADGETVILVTNYEDEEVELTADIAKSLGGKNFYKYVYTTTNVVPDANADMIKASGEVKDVTDKLCDTVPALSVTVYTTEKPE